MKNILIGCLVFVMIHRACGTALALYEDRLLPGESMLHGLIAKRDYIEMNNGVWSYFQCPECKSLDVYRIETVEFKEVDNIKASEIMEEFKNVRK